MRQMILLFQISAWLILTEIPTCGFAAAVGHIACLRDLVSQVPRAPGDSPRLQLSPASRAESPVD